jgi:uncharacterized membrane protein YqgA involved in biofilm formation
VLGTILNTAGIVLGCLVGLFWKKNLSLAHQFFFKSAIGAFTVFYGLRLTVLSFSGPFLHILKQLVIVLMAMALGKITGRLLHLQKTSNRVGQFARERIARARPDNPNRFSDGFSVCGALFCVAPLGILGAIHDGLSGYFYPLAVKAVMDALAAMSFVAIFGPGVLFSAVPVLVLQGTLTLVCSRFLAPFLEAHGLIEPINAIGGLLIFCVALLIFEIKKIEVADYLPSLFFAPLLAYFLV